MKVLRLTLIVGLSASRLWSSQVDGVWTAEVAGRSGGITALRMTLKEEDGMVTGNVRGSRGEEPISDGEIDGDIVTITVVTEFRGEQVEQHYRGTIDGDVIHFHVTSDSKEKTDRPMRDFEAERTSADPPTYSERL